MKRALPRPTSRFYAAAIVVVGILVAVLGVYVLWGVGWALLAAGPACVAFGLTLVDVD